jgi:hypothetical protein
MSKEAFWFSKGSNFLMRGFPSKINAFLIIDLPVDFIVLEFIQEGPLKSFMSNLKL